MTTATKTTFERRSGTYHAIVWKMQGANWMVHAHCPHEHHSSAAALRCGDKIRHQLEREKESKDLTAKGKKK